jgi:hypothetical protein
MVTGPPEKPGQLGTLASVFLLLVSRLMAPCERAELQIQNQSCGRAGARKQLHRSRKQVTVAALLIRRQFAARPVPQLDVLYPDCCSLVFIHPTSGRRSWAEAN